MNTSFCDIINLKIINRSIVELEDNKYKFNNNLFSLNDDFLIDYDLYFYEDFNGIYNDFDKVIYFLIPPNYVSSNLQYNEDISSSGFNQFYLIATDISSYDDFYSYVEENNSGSSGDEDEEEVEPLPDDFEPPEVYDSSEGGATPRNRGGGVAVIDISGESEGIPAANSGVYIDYNETILHNNTRHISQFCKLSKLYIIKVYPNNHIEFKNTSLTLSNLEFNTPSNGIIPLIPCVVLDGFWDNNQSLDGLWLALPETYQKSSRTFENNKPAQMILDSSNSGVFNLNSDIITSYLNKGENNITITHQMQSINKNNFLTAWSSSEFDDIENNIILENSINGANKINLIIEENNAKKCFYYQLKENDAIIWSSNLCQLNLKTSDDIIEVLPMRYYDTKDLDDNYVRIYDNKGSYIALYIRITARQVDKIVLSYGNSLSSVRENPITFYIQENLNIRDATKQVYIITRENQSQENRLLKSNDAVYFGITASKYKNGAYDDGPTTYYSCPAKEKTYPILDVEPYGVAIGQASTGVQGRPLFEVSSNYTTRFYGPVEIFPVGAIYMSMSPENPSKYFYGIWAPWAQGRMPIGVSTAEGDAEFNSAGLIGGEKAHKLTKEEMPAHSHTYNRQLSSGAGSGVATARYSGKRTNIKTNATGGSQPHNNMPPYITCYMWQRIE